MTSPKRKIEACPPAESSESERQPTAERPPAPPEAEPLAAEIVARYAAEGIDVSGLDSRDAHWLQSFEGFPFKDNDERVAELREIISEITEDRRTSEALPPAPRTPEEIEETAALEEAAETTDAPEKVPAAESRLVAGPGPVFDPEAELRRLLEARRLADQEVDRLPESERSAARKELRRKFKNDVIRFKGELMEQRRGMSSILESVREIVLSGIETKSGRPLGEMIELADRATDPLSPAEALAAQAQLTKLRRKFSWGNVKRSEWWMHGLPLEEVMSPKSAELDEQAMLDAVEKGSDKARLTREQRRVFERLGEKVLDRRRAIAAAKEQAPTPEALYRFCFGREPLGKITVLEGPITLYFRCENIEDYTLIFSQNFSSGEISVSDDDRKMAKKTGGVSISATRAYAPNLEQDPDLLSPDGTPDQDRTEERRQLLIRLKGAIIAENNTVPRKFLDRWRIYRHEEQHAFKKILGEFELERETRTTAETLRSCEESEAAHEATLDQVLQTVLNADGIREKGGDPEKVLQGLRQQVADREKEQDAAEAALRAEVETYTQNWIESMAKDEILAYYLEGRLPEAVEIYDLDIIGPEPTDPDEPLDAELVAPYLKESKDDGGIYDYHANPAAAEWVMNGIISEAAISDAVARYDAMEAAYATDKKEKKNGDLDRQKIAAEIALKDDQRRQVLRPLVHAAMIQHQDRYHQVLDQAKQAIETLETDGMKKQEIIDTLSLEPLKNWPRLAARLVGGRGRTAAAPPERTKKIA